jgi:type I restriction enzyme S subunit
MSELPSAWASVKLGELTQFVTSGSRNWSSYYSSTGALFIRVGDLQRGDISLDLSKVQAVELPSDAEGKRTRLHVGDIVVSITADIGLVGVVAEDLGEAYVSQHVALLRLAPGPIPGYVAWYLASPEGQAQLKARSTGAVKAGLKLDNLRQVLLPLAPLDDQIRIVSAIQRIMESLAEADNAIEKAVQRNRDITGIAVTAAIMGRLTGSGSDTSLTGATPLQRHHEAGAQAVPELFRIPEGWRWGFLEDIVDDGPTNGYSPRSGADADGTYTLRLSATTQGRLLLTQDTVKRVYERIAPDSRFWLRPGDILIQRANSLEYVGTAAIYDGPESTYIYPDLMMRVRIADSVTREYVCLYLNSIPVRSHIRAQATGTAGSMPKISSRVVRRLPIPLPPRRELLRIVQIAREALSISDRVGSQLVSARHGIASIRRSVLASAFRGELAHSDPSDESGGELFERVRLSVESNLPRVASRRTVRMNEPSKGRDKAIGPAHQSARSDKLDEMLQRLGGSTTPEALWRSSGLEIDEFYKVLRSSVAAKTISEGSDKRTLKVCDED